MKPKHDVELQKKICQDFGADLGSELCQEVGSFMEECPECKVFYDTMQRSVKLYRVVEGGWTSIHSSASHYEDVTYVGTMRGAMLYAGY